MKILSIFIILTALTYSALVCAEENRLAGSTRQTPTMYVNDELWITVRAEANGNAEKLAVIKSGTKMSIISYNEGDDYAQVHTEKGQTGWALYRYLSPEPPTSLRLEQTETLLAQTQSQRDEINTALSSLKATNQQQAGQLKQLKDSNQELAQELEQLHAISNDAINNYQQLQTLQQDTETTQQQVTALKEDNETLQSKLISYAIAAAVAGLLAGLYLGTIPLRRDKRWRSMP